METAAIAKEPLFYVDVTAKDLSQEFKSDAVWDKEFKDIKGAPFEADAIVSSLANGGEAARNAVQTIINAGNIPAGALQVGAALTYKVAATVLNTVSLAANATMSLKDGLFYALDTNFREEVQSLTDPQAKKAAFLHYHAMKRAFHRYAKIFSKDDWGMLANGLQRMAKGVVLTAKELGSMSKNVADAILDLGAGVVVGVARPVGIVAAGTVGVFAKALARVCQVLKKIFEAGEKGFDKVGDKSFEAAGKLIDGYAPAKPAQA